ncbi:MAG: uracil-DNA glycosylase [bacterium]
MINRTDILNLTRQFFTQRAELYGRDFYLDLDFAVTSPQNELPELEHFYHEIKDCQNCRLSQSRTHFVFGTGNSEANLMCVGEAPGYEEDKAGEPFVGAAGQLLNRILAAIGFRREEVYIANMIKCRPPGNRDPEPEEVAECLPYLKKQIALIKPKLILALGRVAAQNLLDRSEALGKLRGAIYKYDDIPVVVTYHPAALLRNPQWKRNAWEDVQKLRKIYDQEVGEKPLQELSKVSA